jgi:hypothetical protein
MIRAAGLLPIPTGPFLLTKESQILAGHIAIQQQVYITEPLLELNVTMYLNSVANEMKQKCCGVS